MKTDRSLNKTRRVTQGGGMRDDTSYHNPGSVEQRAGRIELKRGRTNKKKETGGGGTLNPAYIFHFIQFLCFYSPFFFYF